MLKLRPGGPPAIRRPDALDGWPGQTAAHCEALQDSTTVHLVVIEALDAVWSMGGHISWENPPSSMALCHVEVSHFLKRVRADIFPVARSAYDPTFDKEYLFASTVPGLKTHLNGTPVSSANKCWA